MSLPEKTIRCDFCGLEFEPACTKAGCQGCPLSKGCSHIICPRCGYQMLPEAALVSWIRGFTFRRNQSGRMRSTRNADDSQTSL